MANLANNCQKRGGDPSTVYKKIPAHRMLDGNKSERTLQNIIEMMNTYFFKEEEKDFSSCGR